MRWMGKRGMVSGYIEFHHRKFLDFSRFLGNYSDVGQFILVFLLDLAWCFSTASLKYWQLAQVISQEEIVN